MEIVCTRKVPRVQISSSPPDIYNPLFLQRVFLLIAARSYWIHLLDTFQVRTLPHRFPHIYLQDSWIGHALRDQRYEALYDLNAENSLKIFGRPLDMFMAKEDKSLYSSEQGGRYTSSCLYMPHLLFLSRKD